MLLVSENSAYLSKLIAKRRFEAKKSYLLIARYRKRNPMPIGLLWLTTSEVHFPKHLSIDEYVSFLTCFILI